MLAKILIVEDEQKLAAILQDYLRQSSMDTCIVADGADVLATIADYQPDLLLLDIMLPSIDGLTLCRMIRQMESKRYLPIIMTTARVDEIDRLLGLEIGADDYVCKPYSPREVVARVKAVLRRQQQTAEKISPLLSTGLVLNDDKMQARLYEKNLDLTAVEYALLRVMAATPGKIYSRSQLMESIYSDYRVVSERTIDSHIKKLRQKVAACESGALLIHSVYGVGYKFDDDVDV